MVTIYATYICVNVCVYIYIEYLCSPLYLIILIYKIAQGSLEMLNESIKLIQASLGH